MVSDDDKAEIGIPADEAAQDSLEETEGGAGAEVDRTALSALMLQETGMKYQRKQAGAAETNLASDDES